MRHPMGREQTVIEIDNVVCPIILPPGALCRIPDSLGYFRSISPNNGHYHGFLCERHCFRTNFDLLLFPFFPGSDLGSLVFFERLGFPTGCLGEAQ